MSQHTDAQRDQERHTHMHQSQTTEILTILLPVLNEALVSLRQALDTCHLHVFVCVHQQRRVPMHLQVRPKHLLKVLMPA